MVAIGRKKLGELDLILPNEFKSSLVSKSKLVEEKESSSANAED